MRLLPRLEAANRGSPTAQMVGLTGCAATSKQISRSDLHQGAHKSSQVGREEIHQSQITASVSITGPGGSNLWNQASAVPVRTYIVRLYGRMRGIDQYCTSMGVCRKRRMRGTKGTCSMTVVNGSQDIMRRRTLFQPVTELFADISQISCH
ncbi:hypothetical protein ACSS6W_003799 [Trichoderma asperelloides]